jgi:hypothetical protein
VWGCAFSREQEVLDHVSKTTPYLAVLAVWTAVKWFLQVDNPTKRCIVKLLGWSSPLGMCVHCWVAALILSSCQTFCFSMTQCDTVLAS